MGLAPIRVGLAVADGKDGSPAAAARKPVLLGNGAENAATPKGEEECSVCVAVKIRPLVPSEVEQGSRCSLVPNVAPGVSQVRFCGHCPRAEGKACRPEAGWYVSWALQCSFRHGRPHGPSTPARRRASTQQPQLRSSARTTHASLHGSVSLPLCQGRSKEQHMGGRSLGMCAPIATTPASTAFLLQPTKQHHMPGCADALCAKQPRLGRRAIRTQCAACWCAPAWPGGAPSHSCSSRALTAQA